MKVVLKITVLDRILEDLSKAARAHRTVDYVVVTPAEYAELGRDMRVYSHMESPLGLSAIGATPSNATFHTWEFAYQGHDPHLHGRRLRVASHEKLGGYPLLVVPAEYHPR